LFLDAEHQLEILSLAFQFPLLEQRSGPIVSIEVQIFHALLFGAVEQDILFLGQESRSKTNLSYVVSGAASLLILLVSQ
jgi:hypothetical protein